MYINHATSRAVKPNHLDAMWKCDDTKCIKPAAEAFSGSQQNKKGKTKVKGLLSDETIK